MTSIGLMIVGTPRRIIGPCPPQAGRDQWMCGGDAGIERADDSRVGDRFLDPLCQFIGPFMLT